MEFHYNNLVDTLAQFVACITHYMIDYFVPTLDIKKTQICDHHIACSYGTSCEFQCEPTQTDCDVLISECLQRVLDWIIEDGGRTVLSRNEDDSELGVQIIVVNFYKYVKQKSVSRVMIILNVYFFL